MKPFLPGRWEYENYPEMEVWKIILAWQYTWICFVGVFFFSDSTHGKSPFFTTIWENIFGSLFPSAFFQLPAAAGAGCRAKSTCSSGPRGCGRMWGVMGRSYTSITTFGLEKIRFYGSTGFHGFCCDVVCFFSNAFLRKDICLERNHSAMRSGKWEISIVMLLHQTVNSRHVTFFVSIGPMGLLYLPTLNG